MNTKEIYQNYKNYLKEGNLEVKNKSSIFLMDQFLLNKYNDFFKFVHPPNMLFIVFTSDESNFVKSTSVLLLKLLNMNEQSINLLFHFIVIIFSPFSEIKILFS